MSIEALLEAAESELYETAVTDYFSPETCSIQPEGHPPQVMADWYVTLDEGSIEVTEQGRGKLDEKYTIHAWVTLRAGLFAADRRRDMYLATNKRLTELERLVVRSIHGVEHLRRHANELLGISLEAQDGDTSARGGDGEYGSGFNWPLWYQGRTKTETKSAEWIGGSSPDELFFVRQLAFYGGWRLQGLSAMT